MVAEGGLGRGKYACSLQRAGVGLTRLRLGLGGGGGCPTQGLPSRLSDAARPCKRLGDLEQTLGKKEQNDPQALEY